MNNRKLWLGLILFFVFTSAFPCGWAYQFKIFPVGVMGDTIVTVDVKMQRSDYVANITDEETIKEDFYDLQWQLKSYVTKYNSKQIPYSSVLIDSLDVKDGDYSKDLDRIYKQAFLKILQNTKNIKLFTPIDISFCEYQEKCKTVAREENNIIYKNKKYRLEILDLKNRDYYGFNGFYFQGEEDDAYWDTKEGREIYRDIVNGFAIGSIRRFTVSDKELVVIHLQRGHELAMGWITNNPADPRLKRDDDDNDDFAIIMQEHTPDIPFSKIESSVYEEPLMHHGYGFDVFMMK